MINLRSNRLIFSYIFNYGEFTIIKSKSGLNSYKINVKLWNIIIKKFTNLGICCIIKEAVFAEKLRLLRKLLRRKKQWKEKCGVRIPTSSTWWKSSWHLMLWRWRSVWTDLRLSMWSGDIRKFLSKRVQLKM